MAVYEVGGLVRWRSPDLAEDWDAIGIILEMRDMSPRPPDARILWNDVPLPGWQRLSDLLPVSCGGEDGTR